MGGKSSKRSTAGRYSSYSSSSRSWGNQAFPQYAEPSYSYGPPPPNQSYGAPDPETRRRLERKFSKINDDYNSVDQVIY